ncbi:EH domain-containing protein 1-like isoform X2 [Miscanthus floridulus]|uniref:EH domain-containing protein 1-like isoform X2 n=1 Tax=Miscanthus floridulus TaxID=154761 RepID=UPI0034599E57
MGGAAFAAGWRRRSPYVNPREDAARARFCGGGIPRGASCLPLPVVLPLLVSSPDSGREGGERAGREMGPDSSPKKWRLKEQSTTYLQWFALADEDGDGRLTGNDELRFFAMSNLSKPELKQVWAIADSKRQGYLGFYEFMTAMQLVSLAQAGNEISHDTLSSADLERLQPPTMEGLAKKLNSGSKGESAIVACHPSESPIPASWFNSKSAKKIPLKSVTSIIDGLKKSYIEKLRPLEKTYQFHDFVSPLLIAVILMQSQWSCCWVNTPPGKQHS